MKRRRFPVKYDSSKFLPMPLRARKSRTKPTRSSLAPEASASAKAWMRATAAGRSSPDSVAANSTLSTRGSDVNDAAVDSAANLRVAGADPGVPRRTFLDFASGKPGIGIQKECFPDFVEMKVARRVLSCERREKEKPDGCRPSCAPHPRAHARTTQTAEGGRHCPAS